METPKEDIAPRVLALIHAQKTLQREGVITGVVNNRIRKRIAEILETHPEITDVIEEFHSKAELAAKANGQVSEPIESKIPAELRQELSKDQLTLVETLLKLGPNGEIVAVKDLVKAIYNEDFDAKNPCPDKLRVTIMFARRKITGWGEIHTKVGHGYCLKVEAKQQRTTAR